MLPTEDQKALDALVAKGIRIPPQPRVLIELRKAIDSSDYTVGTISRIINQDPGLVAMLFKISRSPAFSRGRQFNKLGDVLQVIGIQQAYNLVQSIALSTAIGGETRNALARFWSRSGEVAELSSLIAEDHVAVCNVFPDQAYLAGIFHQCGVPVLMMRFPDYCKKLHLDDTQNWPDLAEEDAIFGVDHCSIGYLVARHWGCPILSAQRFAITMSSRPKRRVRRYRWSASCSWRSTATSTITGRPIHCGKRSVFGYAKNSESRRTNLTITSTRCCAASTSRRFSTRGTASAAGRGVVQPRKRLTM